MSNYNVRITDKALSDMECIYNYISLGAKVGKNVLKSTDYYVVYSRFPSRAKLAKVLEWRKKGVRNHIISVYQLWEAILTQKGEL